MMSSKTKKNNYDEKEVEVEKPKAKKSIRQFLNSIQPFNCLYFMSATALFYLVLLK